MLKSPGLVRLTADHPPPKLCTREVPNLVELLDIFSVLKTGTGSHNIMTAMGLGAGCSHRMMEIAVSQLVLPEVREAFLKHLLHQLSRERIGSPFREGMLWGKIPMAHFWEWKGISGRGIFFLFLLLLQILSFAPSAAYECPCSPKNRTREGSLECGVGGARGTVQHSGISLALKLLL